MRNKYCILEDLHNEADVEALFIDRFLTDLHYPDDAVKRKESLSSLVVGGMRGMSQREYRPDYALKKDRCVRWIVEAKAPDENLDHHVWQPKGYCMLLNGEYREENPTKYYLLTNARKSRLYEWDRNEPLMELDFSDFADGNERFSRLRTALSWEGLPAGEKDGDGRVCDFCIVKETIEDVNAAFSWCHQHIYKKDNISQSEAFSEFVKLIALKLLSDRGLKEKYPEAVAEREIFVPSSDVRFSTKWIDAEAANCANPMSDIQFVAFASKLEAEIARGERKRFFDSGAKINLKAETIYGVVKKLEKIYLFGIDADLNGRLFETFLSATMRGKDLGQFFTPRSLVKRGVCLAQLQVHARRSDGTYHTDRVIDACCGTGGFLIEVFSDMCRKADARENLSQTEKEAIKEQIRKQYLVGIDIGRGPNLARVARLNMYLHGDGGTRIFNVDALDKQLRVLDTDDVEILREKEELKKILADRDYFDVAITNPPFAKVYERSLESEDRILGQYRIGKDEADNLRSSVKSSLLFMERYYDLLKPGGRLVTVIDDGILSGRDYTWFRDYLRSIFLVRAVVSMPGDAFQRSRARVKTSIIVLEKRRKGVRQDQPPVFMYACKYVGNDDPSRQRVLPSDAHIRECARREITEVCTLYERFLDGIGDPAYTVAPEKITDRLDVKNCLLARGRSVAEWERRGWTVYAVGDVVLPKAFHEGNTIITRNNDEQIRQIIVRYNGDVEAGDEISARNIQYPKLYVVNAGDIVISNIAASYGSVGVVPAYLDGCAVSSEYTVLQAVAPFQAAILKCMLRTPEIRAEILLSSTGSNRTRMQWEELRRIKIIYPDRETESEMLRCIEKADRLEEAWREARSLAGEIAEKKYRLASEEAYGILEAFRPPK